MSLRTHPFVRVARHVRQCTHALTALNNRYRRIIERPSIPIHISPVVPYTFDPCDTTTRHLAGITGGSTGTAPCRRSASYRTPASSKRCAPASFQRRHSRTYELDLHRSVTVREPPPSEAALLVFRPFSHNSTQRGRPVRLEGLVRRAQFSTLTIEEIAGNGTGFEDRWGSRGPVT
jgi:hypothetical protein